MNIQNFALPSLHPGLLSIGLVPNKFFKLGVLNINCQSLVNKKAEFHVLLELHNPDIVIGTESWLKPNHLDSEFFPRSLGSATLHFVRIWGAGTVGGGVFILVKDTIIATEQEQLKTDYEIIWIKLDIVAAKPLYIAAWKN